MKKNLGVAVFIAAAVLVAGPAHATDISGLYSTGQVGTDGADAHWTLDTGTAYVVTNVNGGWATTQSSGWIGPVADGYQSVDAITYTYSTSFSLAGLNAATASFSGIFAADDVATIYLNGHKISPDNAGTYGSTTAFASVAGDFVGGTNTLTFVTVNSGGGPAGLNVEVTGTASAVPEPATWAMMLIGFGMVGSGVRSRRRQTVKFAAA